MNSLTDLNSHKTTNQRKWTINVHMCSKTYFSWHCLFGVLNEKNNFFNESIVFICNLMETTVYFSLYTFLLMF